MGASISIIQFVRFYRGVSTTGMMQQPKKCQILQRCKNNRLQYMMGWRSSLRHCATSRKVAGSIPDGVLAFFIDLILRPRYSPGVDSASNRNE
jgi:hypothetical protein